VLGRLRLSPDCLGHLAHRPRPGTAPGADADIAIWDPTITRTIRDADLHNGRDDTPHEGIEVTGRPVTTLVRGHVVVENKVLKATKGIGAVLKRGRPAFVPGYAVRARGRFLT